MNNSAWKLRPSNPNCKLSKDAWKHSSRECRQPLNRSALAETAFEGKLVAIVPDIHQLPRQLEYHNHRKGAPIATAIGILMTRYHIPMIYHRAYGKANATPL